MYESSLANPTFVKTFDIHSDMNNENTIEVTVIHSIFHAPTIIIASAKYPKP